jgi:uncharacterized protein YqgC (DUF456 family)
MLVLLASWVLTLLNLPGNWMIVLATAVYAILVPAKSPVAIGWKVVTILLVLAALGEVIELVSGAAGAKRAGGSKRGAALALAGSVVGGFLGILVGLPIPLLGPIFAALLFAGLGAMAGAIFGEVWAGKTVGTSWQVGRAAFFGRLTGTLGKMLVGAAMMAIVVAAWLLQLLA